MSGWRLFWRCLKAVFIGGGIVLLIATLIAWDQDRTKNRWPR